MQSSNPIICYMRFSFWQNIKFPCACPEFWCVHVELWMHMKIAISRVEYLTGAIFLWQADENRDERLTLDEMLNHPYIFYSTAYDEDEFDYSQHDEFR